MSKSLPKFAAIQLLMFALVLGGCSDPVKDAKDRYEIVQRTGDKQEICIKSRELAEMYLKQKDEEEYKNQKMAAAIECQSADLERRGS